MNKLSSRPQNANFGLRMKSVNNNKAKKNEEIYYRNPKHCKQCSSILPYCSYKDFCNRSCSATFNNKKRNAPSVETNKKRSAALILFYNENQKTANSRIPKKLKFSVIQYSTCKLCKSNFYVKHHKNIKNNICGECKSTNYSLVPNNVCNCCSVSFLSRYHQKYCEACSPNLRHYRTRAAFSFNVYEYPCEFDLDIIKEYGWYSPNGYKRRNKTPNLNGVSRDHLYTVAEGFSNKVDPTILAHPANCQIILHSNNNSKNSKSTITLFELQNKILNWNKKYY